jgi:hypothetical protein
MERLALLGDRPSPVLDFVNAAANGKIGGGNSLWRDVVAVTMQSSAGQKMTGDLLRSRLAVWIHADRARLAGIEQVRGLLPPL